jgi:hypothetical protein
MTEQQWLTETDPKPLLEFLKGKASARSYWLFTANCWRRWEHMLEDDKSRNGIIALEALAEGQTIEDQHLNLMVGGEICICCGGKYGSSVSGLSSAAGLSSIGLALSRRPEDAAYTAIYSMQMVADAEAAEAEQAESDKYRRIYRPLIAEIFGNPFRPVTVHPSWLTSDVRLLATGIYEEKAFDRLPILADALQDAGCGNDEILNHCRSEGPHVRGCWVVDLLLGKS